MKARAAGGYHPSPADWRDEVLYFLLPDRFSDGREADRPLLTRAEIRALRSSSGPPGMELEGLGRVREAVAGRHARRHPRPVGLSARLGVSTLWIGPVLRQRTRLDTYHGYGIQDFLEVDERFGTRADLVDAGRAGHTRGASASSWT